MGRKKQSRKNNNKKDDSASEEEVEFGSEHNYTVTSSGWGDHDDDDLSAMLNLQADDDTDVDWITSNENPTDPTMETARRQQLLDDILTSLDEYSTIKQSSERESLLKRCYNSLCRYGHDQWDGFDTIVQACATGLRGRSHSEQYASCRVLNVVAILNNQYYETMETLLRRIIVGSSSTSVQRAALCCLTTACFWHDDPVVSRDLCRTLIEGLATLSESASPNLRATAWECWGLLATMDDAIVASPDGRGLLNLEHLRDALFENSIEIQRAAGLCLAYLHESVLNSGNKDDKFGKGKWEDEQSDIMEECRYQMSELAVESSRKISKKTKKAQRATFREFLNTIEDDESPQLTLFIRDYGSLDLNSWQDIIRLQCMRRCLQGGFQNQLLTNENLQQLFGITVTRKLSKFEKRMYRSKTSESSKLADQDRKTKRDKRNKIKNHFLHVDE